MMSGFQIEERNKIRRHLVDHAIALAMQNRWSDAAKLNQQVLELFPEDTDAFNRLGRAQMELGRYRDARAAYQKTVQLDPSNTIARKNLSRLANIKVEEAAPSGEKVDPRMFIAETGKTGVISLAHPAPRDVLAKLSAGDQVVLRVDGRSLKVESMSGIGLGQIEPKLGQRLIDLLRTGNRYTAAAMAMEDGNLRVFIRETHQDPNNSGKVSFPIRGEGPGIRAYTRETLLKYELEEEDDADSDDTEFGEREEEHEEPLEVGDIEDDRGTE